MCGCPAHSELVDCTGCMCDHGGDRITQWKARAKQLERERAPIRRAVLGEAANALGALGPEGMPQTPLEFVAWLRERADA
jgi:hypothetical protein